MEAAKFPSKKPRTIARNFAIYFSTGSVKAVSAPSLRTAIRQVEQKHKGAVIVVALAAECLPPPPAANVPFHAVLLRNPNHVATDDE